MAIFAPLLSPYSYSDIHLSLKNTPPCKAFWFGTDELGRDIFTRLWWGARISLFIGLFAALIDGILGVVFGSISGYVGGRVDLCMMRGCDILYSIPYLLMVILLTVIRGSGITTLIIAICFTGWINMARITRAQVLLLKEMNYVLAAKSMGASFFRIMRVHLYPNARGPIFATLMLTIPTAIFTEAFLSFIGLGIQAPKPSLGNMIHDALSAMRYYPWRLLFPSLLISSTILAFNIVASGLKKES